MYDIVKEMSSTKTKTKPFDLEHWILKKRYKRAVANTNKLIKELKK